MPVRAACPNCRAVNTYPDAPEAKRKVACSACGREFVIAARPAIPVVQPSPSPPLPPVDEMPVAELAPEDAVVADLEEPAPAELAEAELADEPAPDISLEVTHKAKPVAKVPRARDEEEREDVPQPPGLPFELKRDERVLLRAGFGGVTGWVWLCTLLPMSVGCFSLLAILQSLAALLEGHYFGLLFWLLFLPLVLALGFWPLLRTGRYWLTTQRVIWKPRFGKLQEMQLRKIDTDEIKANLVKAKLIVYGTKNQKIAFRFVSGMDRLWGGILMLADMDPDDLVPSGKGVADVSWWRGYKSTGMSQQLGLIVLRPEYVAFLPTGQSKHLGAELFKETVGKAILNALGKKEEYPAEANIPFDVLVGLMSEHSPKEFDRFIQDAVEQFDGVSFWKDEADAFREAIWRPGRTAVAFRSEGVQITGTPARDQEDTINRILENWTEGESLPTRYPIKRMAIVGLVTTAITGALVYQALRYNEPVVEVGNVSSAQVMDKTVAPDTSFVTITGHIDPQHITHIKPKRKSSTAHVLVTFKEAPMLMLYLPDHHDLSKAIQNWEAAKTPKARDTAYKELLQPWTVSGRLYAGDKPDTIDTNIPSNATHDFARTHMGTDAGSTRVLKVGSSPGDQVAMMWIAIGFAGFFGSLAALGWWNVTRGILFGYLIRGA